MELDLPPDAWELIWRFLAGSDNSHEVLLTLSEVCIGFAIHFQSEAYWKDAYFVRYQSYRKPGSLITTMTKLPPHERHSWRAALREALVLEETPVKRGTYSKSDELPPRCAWTAMDKVTESEDVTILRQIVMEQRTKMRHSEKDYKTILDQLAEAKSKFEDAERRHSAARNRLSQSGYGERLPPRSRCRRPMEPEKFVMQPRPVGADPRTRLSLEFVANENNIRAQTEQLDIAAMCVQEYEAFAREEDTRLAELRECVPVEVYQRRRTMNEAKIVADKLASSLKQGKSQGFKPAPRSKRGDISKDFPYRSVAPNPGKSLLRTASYIACERYNSMWTGSQASPSTNVAPMSSSRGSSPSCRANMPLLSLRQSTIMSTYSPPSTPRPSPRSSSSALHAAQESSHTLNSGTRATTARRSDSVSRQTSASSLATPRKADSVARQTSASIGRPRQTSRGYAGGQMSTSSLVTPRQANRDVGGRTSASSLVTPRQARDVAGGTSASSLGTPRQTSRGYVVGRTSASSLVTPRQASRDVARQTSASSLATPRQAGRDVARQTPLSHKNIPGRKEAQRSAPVSYPSHKSMVRKAGVV